MAQAHLDAKGFEIPFSNRMKARREGYLESSNGDGMLRRPEVEPRGRSTELVVLLHAYTLTPDSLVHVRKVVANELPDADIVAPAIPAGVFSLSDPLGIAWYVVSVIDRAWEVRNVRDGEYARITLVGHSLGALIARKVYVLACGENPEAPFESVPTQTPTEAAPDQSGVRGWARCVDRIILLAAMNRGWSISHHMSLGRAIAWWVGTLVGDALAFFTGRPPLIFGIRRGAPFLTQLRMQWLSLRDHAPQKGAGGALTVQLLGSIDDMVSPDDNIDLVAGRDFVYLDVPHSGHANVIEMGDSAIGRARASVFQKALTMSRKELEPDEVRPADLPLPARRDEVSDVIFVVHGIRDLGYWTNKIARRIKALAKAEHRVFETETSSYGYFPMLSFLLPSRRREKVEWLMDQYAEAKALYPNAEFSFVGHSNGTYLVARALRDYTCCRFKHVVFAGSVVATTYEWRGLLQAGRVKGVLNYVATGDWVVALFPKAIQLLGLQDLGSAGHDGFVQADGRSVHEIEYVLGSHNAALAEDNWDAMARFVVEGATVRPPKPLDAESRSRLVMFLGYISPVVWLIIGAVLVLGGWAILGADWAEWLKTSVLIAYGYAILKILTRL